MAKTFKRNRWSWKRTYSREKRIEGLDVNEYTVWAHSKEGYDFFKENRNAVKKAGKVDKHLYAKVVNEFFKKVSDYVVSCSDGVYIENLGYFGGMIYADKAMSSNPFYHEVYEVGVPLISAHTDGKVYCLCFVHDKYKPQSRTFLPDYSFSQNMKRKFSQALFGGQKYRFNATLFI